MLNVPTLFLRDPDDRRFVYARVTLGCEWVLAGEGVATRQYDGVCVMFGAERDPEVHPPELRGWWVEARDGWEPAWQSKYARPLQEAIANLPDSDSPVPGTHELIGPKINRDPEKVGRHLLIAHRDADIVDAPRTFDGLSRWLLSHPYEGVVWHHPDGRMAKLKRKDVRRG